MSISFPPDAMLCTDRLRSSRGPTSPLTCSGEFASLPYLVSAPELCMAGSSMMHIDKNRYTDIIAPDTTRAKILSPLDNPLDPGYINANWVDIGDGERMIACQGPLNSTIPDFWRMVWQNEVGLVVMLTQLVERGREKCARYWPLPGETAEYGVWGERMSVTTRSVEMVGRGIALTKIELSYSPNPGVEVQTRVVNHLLFKSWPDQGIASVEEVRLLVGLVVSLMGAGSTSSNLVCHCSAGVGRTGVLVAIIRCLATGEHPIEAVKSLRKERHGMVQTVQQFRFIVEVLKEGL